MNLYQANSLSNAQLTQSQLIEQQFSGFPAINDTVKQEVDIILPYLLDLYIYKNKTTLTMIEYHSLALFARYLVDESVKYNDLPVLRARYTLIYDYTLVPTFTATTQTRTGKIIFDETLGQFIYRFVVADIPNSPTFDVYHNSNITVTDVSVVFDFGNINFINWLQNNRFKAVAVTLENYFDTNFTLVDLIDYIKIVGSASGNSASGNRTSSNMIAVGSAEQGIIKYLSDSLEFIESLA